MSVSIPNNASLHRNPLINAGKTVVWNPRGSWALTSSAGIAVQRYVFDTDAAPDMKSGAALRITRS